MTPMGPVTCVRTSQARTAASCPGWSPSRASVHAGHVNDGHLPIGRFARLCRLSVKQLRHYDEVGLLTEDPGPDAGVHGALRARHERLAPRDLPVRRPRNRPGTDAHDPAPPGPRDLTICPEIVRSSARAGRADDRPLRSRADIAGGGPPAFPLTGISVVSAHVRRSGIHLFMLRPAPRRGTSPPAPCPTGSPNTYSS
jgi:hypothetical protein